jgi:hypothetical protein
MNISSSPSERSKRYPRKRGLLVDLYLPWSLFALFLKLFLRLVFHLASLFSLTLALFSFMPFHSVVVEYHSPSIFKEKREFSFW